MLVELVADAAIGIALVVPTSWILFRISPSGYKAKFDTMFGHFAFGAALIVVGHIVKSLAR